MKRCPSSTTPSDTSSATPSPAKKSKPSTPAAKVKVEPDSVTKQTKSPKDEKDGGNNAKTGEKAALAEHLVLLGLKHLDLAIAAEEVKRSPSATPPPRAPTPSDTKSTPKKKKTTTKFGSPSKTPSMSLQSRGEFLDELIGIAAKHADLAALAEKYGVKKSQMVDQIKPNRSNIRSKAVKAVQGGE